MNGKSSLTSTFLVGDPDMGLYQLVSPEVTHGNIDIAKAHELAQQSPMWAARGQAIQAYAILEQELCHLFRLTSKVSKEAAAIVFYKITNYRARNDILEKLIKETHGNKYSLFWNSFFNYLRTADLTRNELIHWLSAVNVAKNQFGQTMIGVNLVSPQSLPKKERGELRTLNDVNAFIEKCIIMSAICTQFNLRQARPDLSDFFEKAGKDDPWQSIFLQELVYPLPSDHPLFRTSDKLETQPPPSPG